MNKENNKFEDFAPEISVEEFDRIDEAKEKHIFSDRYNRRKESQLKAYRKEMLGFASRGFAKTAIAAAVLVIATPFAVNAATNGELFQRLWGNAGKQTIESHEETFIEEEKIDENGNPNEITVTMPKVEYVEADEEKAQELIGDNIASEPTVIQMGDTKMTVLSVTRDKNGIVAEYTLEKEGGVDCLNYSELDNECKGAWINEDQNILFAFNEGSGKIYVDLEKSTPDKLYCYEYMVDNRAGFDSSDVALTSDDIITDHLTLWYRLYSKPRSEVLAILEEDPDVDLDAYEAQFISEENSVNIPVSDEISTTTFVSKDGGSLEISPIAMNVDLNQGIDFSNTLEGIACLDNVYNMEITYKDGSTYLMYARKYPYDSGDVFNPAEEVESISYICGSINNHVITLFNRLVDVEQVEKITINGTEFTQK